MLSCNCHRLLPLCPVARPASADRGLLPRPGRVFRIDAGHYGRDVLDLSAARQVLAPRDGNSWIYEPGQLDSRAFFWTNGPRIYAEKAIGRIFTGKAGGSTGLLSILVGNFLGMERQPITYEVEDKTRIFQIPKIIDGAVTPIRGNGPRTAIPSSPIPNTGSRPRSWWPNSDKSRMRAFGRNWNFAGRSAEICKLGLARPVNKNIIGRKLLERFPQLSKKVTWPQTRAFLGPSADGLRFLPRIPVAGRPRRSSNGPPCSCGWGWRSSSTA